MKKILFLVAMLRIMLFSVESAYAVFGVNDDVPGTDTVFPIICEKGGTLDTSWAIADTVGGNYFDANVGVAGEFVSGISAKASVYVLDRRSEIVYDTREQWTPFDVISEHCQGIITDMSDDQRAAMEVTIDGKVYYAGYIIYKNDWAGNDAAHSGADRFVNWVYLTDLPKGFASGFNGFSAEISLDLVNLSEDGIPVTAEALYPRVLVYNDNPDTWNWWIILKGANATPPIFPVAGVHRLEGVIYNEEECGVSRNILIPDELNIIDVGPLLSGKCFPAGVYPQAGFGVFSAVALNSAPPFYTFSTFGWSYQRVQSNSVQASWDVMHPMHRRPLLDAHTDN